MREIKFRAWIGALNCWADEIIISQVGDVWGYIAIKNDNKYFNAGLEQFTGLSDKNGKEIYEGDIVLVGDFKDYGDGPEWGDHSTHSIKWMDGYPAFDLSPQLDTDCNGLQYALEVQSVEVIGNIHENTELLK